MKNNSQRNLRVGITVALALLIASSVAAFYTINRLIDSSKWVEHTNKVLNVSENVISEVKDGETGQRGYLLTKQMDFLEPYNGSFERALNYLDELRKLTVDNVQQQLNCDSLEGMIRSRYAVLNGLIEDAKRGVEPDVFRLRDGNVHMQKVRLLVKKIQHIEENLLAQRTIQQSRFTKFAPIAIIVASLFSLLITIFFFKRVMDDSRKKTKMTDELKAKDIEIGNRIALIEDIAGKFATGDFSVKLNTEEKDTLGNLAASVNRMATSLDKSFTKLKANEWLQKGVADLSESIAGEKDPVELSEEAISFIARYTNSEIGALYILDTDKTLFISGGYALPAELKNRRLKIGESLAGECIKANKPIWVKDIGKDLYTNFSSGTIQPRQIYLSPVTFESKTIGVLELGTVTSFTEEHAAFLLRTGDLLGITVNMAQNRMRLKELLEETQSQSEELQAQHRELENMNTELEAQAEKLQASEEELKVQQEELMETNQQLEERSRLLEEKNHIVVVRNLEIQRKAEELALSTRYKSEFLANMSHELRTPLNSVLLLARLLSENTPGNLTNEQVEYAQVIQNSGQSLLQLIDEILDLSKIESGKLELEYDRVNVQELTQNMRMLFQPMAQEKNIGFYIRVNEKLPGIIETDKQRLEQILRNLLSNALKFTHAGHIELIVEPSATKANSVDFTVADSGIGIPFEKQQLVFEAFQQADGSTRRKYGGTGLGLSISRQLARLLSGDISLKSEIDIGSRFTLTIPLFKPEQQAQPIEETIPVPKVEKQVKQAPANPPQYIATDIPEALPDDRGNINEGDKVIMVVEDDIQFARALLDFTRQKNYKTIHIVRGDKVLESAVAFKPTGILLDIQLPMKDGLSVMDELKKDSRTRHIPVHIMSSFEVKKESINRGAIDFINKPVLFDQMGAVLEKIEAAVNSEAKKVLIVEDNSYHAKALAYFLSENHVKAEISSNITAGVEMLQREDVNCVIVDMAVTGLKAYEALESVKNHDGLENIPIIIFTGQTLSRNDEQKIRQYADAIVVKTAHSYQRILNEVSLFLHLVDPSDKKLVNGKGLGKIDEVLKDKKVLIADDDVRNIFALTKALEKHKMNVVPAVDGKEALQLLDKNNDVDIILMDMMMPEMDGYESIINIRKDPKWRKLPIIAVTAKTMSGDREKCIQAGASDYISKPVDTDQLLSLMRVWLYEKI